MNKKIILAGVTVALILVGAGCDTETKQSSGNQEQNYTEANQRRLLDQQPPVSLDWSLERENINKRTTLWNNPNKVSYIYLVNYGKVMAFYTIKGKVSSVNSQITNPEQLTWRCVNSDGTYSSSGLCGSSYKKIVEGTLPSPSEDGSYGTNGNAIFFFTTDGAYVEWAGDYMLADQPLKLTTQPELVREIK